ncbi:MAG: hypothetical protein V3S48_03215 [Candidatus Neomarinimicrobiota bacterium]
MSSTMIFGAWISVFLTFGIFSYLYKDNPFYKFAEHLFVGVSAGYWTSIFFWTQIQPNLFGRLWPKTEYTDNLWYGIYKGLSFFSSTIFPVGGIDKGHALQMIYLIPLALGIMMLLSLIPKVNWFARWCIGYTVGMAAGLRAYGYLNSNVIAQIKASAFKFGNFDQPFFSLSGDSYFNSLVLLVGTISGLLYFYFSKSHTGLFGKISRVGIFFLMISFGASFGFAVMGRISLLIGRFVDLIKYSNQDYNYATLWILPVLILVLAFSAYKDKAKNKPIVNEK